MRVLAVDDHAEVRELILRSLEREGHQVDTAASVEGAQTTLATRPYDVIILDIGLPDGSGLDWCRELRREGNTTPILVLTARTQVADRVEGLDAGADDFLGKPFAVAELRARVRALGRRGPMPKDMLLKREGIEVDFGARKAMAEGKEVPLTAREWSVLEMLVRRSGRVASREEILEQIWGELSEATSASLDVIIGRIRKKLGEGVIRTVRGEGYALG